jgi:hypothetical protein
MELTGQQMVGEVTGRSMPERWPAAKARGRRHGAAPARLDSACLRFIGGWGLQIGVSTPCDRWRRKRRGRGWRSGARGLAGAGRNRPTTMAAHRRSTGSWGSGDGEANEEKCELLGGSLASFFPLPRNEESKLHLHRSQRPPIGFFAVLLPKIGVQLFFR